MNNIVDLVTYTTTDPHTPGFPAMTTMLYRVCGNDQGKFIEAMRLVELYINRTIDLLEKRT